MSDLVENNSDRPSSGQYQIGGFCEWVRNQVEYKKLPVCPKKKHGVTKKILRVCI